jgi:hypothetical protein
VDQASKELPIKQELINLTWMAAAMLPDVNNLRALAALISPEITS